MQFVDAYRAHDTIVCWYKHDGKNIRIAQPSTSTLYIETSNLAKQYLARQGTTFKRRLLRGITQPLDVLEVHVPCHRMRSFVRALEEDNHFRIGLYNADIPPEQFIVYTKHLTPCEAPLTDMHLDIHGHDRVRELHIDTTILRGSERAILTEFSTLFTQQDPDVLRIPHGYSRLPFLYDRLRSHDIDIPFHRWDCQPITYREGRSYSSYGQVHYQDGRLTLRGRLLVDTSTITGSCSTATLARLAQLGTVLFQTVASRTYGAVFQHALIAHLVRSDILVPYKQKPLSIPLRLTELIKTDRAGHTFDPLVGFHTNVGEIDFSSMYPHIMMHKNISAETVGLTGQETPGIPFRVRHDKTGIVGTVLAPFLEERMRAKHDDTKQELYRALKGMLVSCYGYQRYREFKLGVGRSHMTIGAWARELLMQAKECAERDGFHIIHGIIDSLYVTKPHITPSCMTQLSKSVEEQTSIPVSNEGIYKWIVFLSSVQDRSRPVPARYFGVSTDGRIKARGIEVRQRSAPRIIKHFQQECLEALAECETKKDIINQLSRLKRILQRYCKKIPRSSAHDLEKVIRISRLDYKSDIAQKIILRRLARNNETIHPGQYIRLFHSTRGPRLTAEYTNNPDTKKYTDLLVRALHTLMQPFGVHKESLTNAALFQQTLHAYFDISDERESSAHELAIRDRCGASGSESPNIHIP